MNIENKSGIYCIENKVNGKKYIGQSKKIKNRINRHKKNSQDIENNHPLYRAIRKYGIDSFDFYVIEFCDNDNLDDKEQSYIRNMKSLISEKGYNLCLRAKNRTGLKNSDSHNKKISKANSGKKHYNYGKRGNETPHFGFVHSQENRNLISRNCRGKQIGKKEKNSSSKFHGVYKNRNSQIKNNKKYEYIYWVAEIKNIEFRKVIGFFKDEEEAAKAYDFYVLSNNLKNYPLNFEGR